MDSEDPVATCVIHPDDEPMRIDRAAVVHLGVASRSRARRLIRRGAVLLNGTPCEPSRFVTVGDSLVLLEDHESPARFDHPLAIVFADADLAVVLKPAGLVVDGKGVRTVSNALPGNLGPSAAADALPNPRPVHRLDRRTSGLLIVARSRTALVGLGRAFEERRIHKRYRALAGGLLDGDGRCDEPIDGRSASSTWRALQRTRSVTTDWVTTVDVFPESGRKHQVRLHLAALGAPILGDDLHSGDRPVLRSQGLFLCACELAFAHPRTGDALRFETPEPPKFESFRRREVRRWERLHRSQ
jgi:RluA family pseudouridine synthase